jgi:hypothetical protein
VNKAERGQGQGHAVRNGKCTHGLDQLTESAHEQQQAKHEEQMIDAGQNMLDSKSKIRADDFYSAGSGLDDE